MYWSTRAAGGWARRQEGEGWATGRARFNCKQPAHWVGPCVEGLHLHSRHARVVVAICALAHGRQRFRGIAPAATGCALLVHASSACCRHSAATSTYEKAYQHSIPANKQSRSQSIPAEQEVALPSSAHPASPHPPPGLQCQRRRWGSRGTAPHSRRRSGARKQPARSRDTASCGEWREGVWAGRWRAAGEASGSVVHVDSAAPSGALPAARRCSGAPSQRPHRQSRQWNSPSCGCCPPPPKPSGHTAGRGACAAACGAPVSSEAGAPRAASAGGGPSLPTPAAPCPSPTVSRARPPILDRKGHCPAGAAAPLPLGVRAAAAPASAAPGGAAASAAAIGASGALDRGHKCLNGQPEPDMAARAGCSCRNQQASTGSCLNELPYVIEAGGQPHAMRKGPTRHAEPTEAHCALHCLLFLSAVCAIICGKACASPRGLPKVSETENWSTGCYRPSRCVTTPGAPWYG